MTASKKSYAKWAEAKKAGKSWGQVGHQNLDDVDAFAASLGMTKKAHVEHAGKKFQGVATWEGTSQQKKKLQQYYKELPHKPPSGIVKTLKPLGKLIQYGSMAAVGAGLAGAALGAGGLSGIGSAASDAVSGAGDLLSSVTGGGGFGLGGASLGGAGALANVIGGDSMDTNWLDDVFAGLNKAGQYAQQGRATLDNLTASFGGGGSDGGGGGGGSSGGDMGPVTAAPSSSAGWAKSAPWILGGLAVLVVLVLVLKRK
jgi:hypothetical protein